MATKLVIVESPTKAKTISGYLGPDYEVTSSMGHIRDLFDNGRSLPEELRKKWWADYSVDVDAGFVPLYTVPAKSKEHVTRLKSMIKGKDELILATDEDREGEAISWHILEVLKPSSKVKVKRIAFHEITRDAIQQALREPRDVDTKLVDAQETRRILDRLYGYTLSPVLWSRVNKGLSAGRVQSPAVKLVVEREIARRNFRKAGYWDLKATLSKDEQAFTAELRTVDGQRVASGKDFDDTTGELKTEGKLLLLDEATAKGLADKAAVAEPWKVASVEQNEAFERPAPPFMTTTLQQDANRKFGFPADRTMRIAQQLYEGIDLGGEQVGLITYMRTDSLTLSSQALQNIRGMIGREYPDCLPDKAVNYTSKVRNAQEAHEAIRPTDADRRPDAMRRHLSDDQHKLYDLIWKRTVASQMKPAKVLKTEVEIVVDVDGKPLGFRATGKQILFDGFRRLYEEGKDDVDDENETTLPRIKANDLLDCKKVDALGHETKPPPRFTDATLIRELERQGIGRPSTYASILKVIEDRGYVRKTGRQLIPTWTAFLTMDVLNQNFGEVMDITFTARMDDALDEISEGREAPAEYLKEFFIGTEEKPGLKTMVDERKKTIPFPAFLAGVHPETGEEIFVRTNPDGNPFLQLGPRENKKYADVDPDLSPADLTMEKILECFEGKSAPAEAVGSHPITGRRLLLKKGRSGGFYLEGERTDEEIEAKVKPDWVSLPSGVDPRTLSQEDISFLASLPAEIGKVDGEPITFRIGKFGPYLQKGSEIRNVDDWRAAQTMTVDQALTILAQPKYASQRKAAEPIQTFTVDGTTVKVLAGRFGPYVTDGETNATLPKSHDPATITVEVAMELLAAKKAAGPAPKKTKRTVKKKK
jgi:DNA topoisomerase-1